MSQKTRGKGVKKGVNPNSPQMKSFRQQAIEALKNQHVRNLIKYHEQFEDFWKLYCRSRSIKYSDFIKDEKIRKQAGQYLRSVKFSQDDTNKRTTKRIVTDNYVVYEVEKVEKIKQTPTLLKLGKTKSILKRDENYEESNDDVEIETQVKRKEIRVDNDKRKQRRNAGERYRQDLTLINQEPDFVDEEIGEDQENKVEVDNNEKEIGETDISEIELIKKSVKVERRKISEISFASKITVSTVKRIEELAEFKQFFCEDYLYFLGGGKDETVKMPDGRVRKRFKEQLVHLEIGNMMRTELKKICDSVVEQLKSTDSSNLNELRKLKEKIYAINDVINATKELDLSPVKFINSIEEGEFSAQKVLQGAIMNDRAMVDNGNIVLEEKKKVADLSKENLDDDLKKLGKSILQSHVINLKDNNEEKVEEEDINDES